MKRKELLEILDHVKHGLAANEVLEQSTCFVFSNGRVFSYNDEVMVSSPIPLDSSFVVPAKELLASLNKAKDEEVVIKITEEELILRCGRYKVGLRLEKELKLPIEEVPIPEKWSPLPEDFEEAVKYCLFSASKDASRPSLCCLHFNGNYVESCDNFRLTKYEYGMDKELVPLLVPAHSICLFLGKGVKEYALTDGRWVHFRTGEEVVFSCRIMSVDEFPDIDHLFDVSASEEIIFPDNTKEILERVKVLTELDLTGRQYISVELSKGRLHFRGEGPSGWAEESTKVSAEGEITFTINPNFLFDILTKVQKASIDKDRTRLWFEGKNFIHILALSSEK